MNNQTSYRRLRRLVIPLFIVAFLFGFVLKGQAQEKPPRPITVTVDLAQHLNFGTIIPTSNAGGSVTVDYNGMPTPSGDILLLHSLQCSSALFIVHAEPGVFVTITYPTSFSLSNSLYSLPVELGEPYIKDKVAKQFITTELETKVNIGGKLSVGSITSNPSGEYIGTFDVTFNQQ